LTHFKDMKSAVETVANATIMSLTIKPEIGHLIE
jgi:hypothetical protein